MFTAFTGYLLSPNILVVLTANNESTTNYEKKFASFPIIFEDIEVFAILIKTSLFKSLTSTVKFLVM